MDDWINKSMTRDEMIDVLIDTMTELYETEAQIKTVVARLEALSLILSGR